jgi:hypothetical protein
VLIHTRKRGPKVKESFISTLPLQKIKRNLKKGQTNICGYLSLPPTP